MNLLVSWAMSVLGTLYLGQLYGLFLILRLSVSSDVTISGSKIVRLSFSNTLIISVSWMVILSVSGAVRLPASRIVTLSICRSV